MRLSNHLDLPEKLADAVDAIGATDFESVVSYLEIAAIDFDRQYGAGSTEYIRRSISEVLGDEVVQEIRAASSGRNSSYSFGARLEKPPKASEQE